jgi:Biotin-lipoyl like
MASVIGIDLADIERLARQARGVAPLAFSIANDGWKALSFRQTLVMYKGAGRWGVVAVSGLVDTGETTPYQNWMRRVAQHVQILSSQADKSVSSDTPQDPSVPLPLKVEQLPDALRAEWRQWWPDHVAYLRFFDSAKKLNGLAFFLFDEDITHTRAAALWRLSQTWSYCWEMQSPRGGRKLFSLKGFGFIGFVIAVAAMFIPIRQSVLAPAEIISLESIVIASPVDGVIKEILVRPNQLVTPNQTLVALDETTLRNRREVLAKSVGSAQAELLATTQKSFESLQSRGEIAPLSGRVEERRAELVFINEQMLRMSIPAPKGGITVFGDPNDWRGRPVSAGERIMLVANPDKLGVLIHVPVGDAIAMEQGARLRLFLHVAPLEPLDGQVIETGYQATMSPDNVASYRIRALLSTKNDLSSRIGLKGTAKLYGPSVLLGYWLLRRPLASVREWFGV